MSEGTRNNDYEDYLAANSTVQVQQNTVQNNFEESFDYNGQQTGDQENQYKVTYTNAEQGSSGDQSGDQSSSVPAHEEELGSFEFAISEPQKAGTKIHYWVYTVTYKTTLSSYKEANEEHSVKRRFSDFVWLRDRIVAEFPGCVVPPVPEKSVLGTVEKFFSSAVDSKALLQYRQRALTKFLCRVGEHPILQKSTYLRQFLDTASENEWTNLKSKKAESGNQPTSRSAISGLFKKPISKEPEWITNHKTFTGKLEEVLRFLKLKLQEMVQRRKQLSLAVSEFAKGFRKLGLIEKSYEEGNLSRTLLETSQRAESASVAVLSQANRETIQVIETVSYYLGMIESIKRVVKVLENFRLDRDDSITNVKNQKVTLEKLQKQPGKDEKVKAQEKVVADAEAKEKSCNENLERAEEQFKRDMERFDVERKVDFSYMLHAFVELQISCSHDLQSIWKDIEVNIEGIENIDDKQQPQQQEESFYDSD